MPWLAPSVIATLSGTIILTACYFYLYYQSQEKYLKIWALSWAIYAARYIFFLLILLWQNSPYLLIGNQLASLISGVLLFYGACLFIDKKFPKSLLILSALGTVWIWVSILSKFSFLVMSLPTFGFLAVIYVWIGYIFLKHSRTAQKEAAIVGIAFIIWGIHKANYPFLKTITWFAPTGYLIAAGLEFIIALGLLIVYFRKTKDELIKNESKFRRMIEKSPLPMIITDRNQDILYFNDKFTDTFGYTRDDIATAKQWWQTGYPDKEYRQKARQAWNDAVAAANINDEEIKMQEWDLTIKDGTVRNCEFYMVPLEDIGLTIIKDITDRKQSETYLKESEDRFRTLYEQAPLSYQSLDINGNFIQVNDTWLKIMGFERNEVIGRNFGEFLHPDWQDHFRENFPRFKAIGEILGVEFEMIKKDGTPIIVSFHGKISKDTDGAFKQTHCIFRDITDQKKMIKEKEILEARLQHAQKMDAIGTLAGGIAHDFNNLLSVITGNTSYALSCLNQKDEVYDVLSDVQEGAKQAQKLTQQLLTFAKGGEPIKKGVDLNQLVKESAEFVSRGAKSICKFDLAHDLWSVEVDEGQLNQVVSNLVINAHQAMPDGGTIHIKTENAEISPEKELDLAAGKYIKLTFKDQGIGIPENHLLKIFEPYFSTKQKGSGLGLASAYSIITKHEGEIIVNSEVGKGTVFYIYLPATSNKIEIKEDKDQPSHRGRGRILIMDDQEPVLKMLGRMLNRMGYETAFARDGLQAIDLYRESYQSFNPFNLVILDLTVPGGMGGTKAVIELLKINPDVKAVVSSGYSNDPIMASYQDYGFCGVVPKPYTKEQMANLLNNIFNKDKNTPARL